MAERPYVLLSCAMSLDGYIDDTAARRLVLSTAEDFDRVDALRAGVDAILVGAGTIRADNPGLLVRSPQRRADRTTRDMADTPVKVTLTRDGNLDAAAKFFTSGGEKLVYTSHSAAATTRQRLDSVATVIDTGHALELAAVLADLAERGTGRLLVEGGGSVHTQFLTANLVDELHLVIAPFFVGEPGAPRFVGPGQFPHDPKNPMRLAETRAIGDLVYARYLAG